MTRAIASSSRRRAWTADASHVRSRRATAAPTWSRQLWVAAIVASAGAGLIHLALGPEHVAELGLLGYGFYLSAALQLSWSAVAAAVLVGAAGKNPRILLGLLAGSGFAINAVIIVAWAFSRTVGLPAGETPWVPEAIGRPDVIAGLLEGVLVVGLIGWLRGWAAPRAARLRSMATAGTIAAIVAMVIGTGVGLAPGEGEMQGHDHAGAAIAGAADMQAMRP